MDLKKIEYTPFGMQGPENYTLDALIAAAESLQYNGKNDIAHCLEARSSAQYIDPLCTYVCTLYLHHVCVALMVLFF